VRIDGKPAFISFVSPTQINVEPADDSNSGPVTVGVSTAAGNSQQVATVMQPVLPGLFAAGGYVAAVRVSDGVTLSAAVPAHPGDTLELYGTGLGPTSPGVPDGLVFEGAYATVNKATVAFGGTAATVLWSGLVGAGLYQINVVVPSIADGDYPVTVTIGNVVSQLAPLIRIRSY
jgi:uncharacterized protein (TIGR03437 family)